MRRALAVLCLALLLCAASAAGETRIMVATDMHYIDPVFYEGSDALARNASFGDGKMPHRSDAWLAALVQEAIAQAPDFLILAGDQTYNGEVLSHKAISEALAAIQAAGIPVLAIPGNHDINNDYAFSYTAEGTHAIHSIPLARYDKYYGEYGRNHAFSRDEASLSYAVRADDTLWILMLDAGIYEPFAEVFGLVEASTQAWMEDLLAQAQAQGARVVSVSHQSMLPHSDTVRGGYMIINWEDVSEVLARHGVRLNLSGHIHVQHIAERDGLYDISLSALSAYPNQYAMVTFMDDGLVRYQTQPLPEAYLPEGLPEEARAFFLQVSHDKALVQLRDAAATPAQKEQMAAFAAEMNLHYYSGTMDTVQELGRADPAYRLWLELGEGVFWHDYLISMLEGDAQDMTYLEFMW